MKIDRQAGGFVEERDKIIIEKKFLLEAFSVDMQVDVYDTFLSNMSMALEG